MAPHANCNWELRTRYVVAVAQVGRGSDLPQYGTLRRTLLRPLSIYLWPLLPSSSSTTHQHFVSPPTLTSPPPHLTSYKLFFGNEITPLIAFSCVVAGWSVVIVHIGIRQRDHTVYIYCIVWSVEWISHIALYLQLGK